MPLAFQNRQSQLRLGSSSNPNLRQSYASSSSDCRLHSYAPSDAQSTINEMDSTPPTSAASFHPQHLQQQQLRIRNTPSPAPSSSNHGNLTGFGDRKNTRIMSVGSDPGSGTNKYNYPTSDTSYVAMLKYSDGVYAQNSFRKVLYMKLSRRVCRHRLSGILSLSTVGRDLEETSTSPEPK